MFFNSKPTQRLTGQSSDCGWRRHGGWALLAIVFLHCAAIVRADDATGPADVAFVARCDGTTQHYVMLLPEGFRNDVSHDLLIALHGHGADRWQFVRDGRPECKAARDVAAEHKMIFISPDYRASTSWMGPKAEADVVQIIEEARDRYRIGRVFLCGGSMGASSALTFAALRPELVDGVAAMNGTANHLEYENFQEAIAESFGGPKTAIPEEYKKRSAEYWPERLSMPVGITAGGRDKSVPPESVLRLGSVLKKIGRPVLVIYREAGGHSTTYADGRRILEFVIEAATQCEPGGDSRCPRFRPD